MGRSSTTTSGVCRVVYCKIARISSLDSRYGKSLSGSVIQGGINFNPGYFLPTYEVIYLIAKPKFKLAPKANAQGDVWRIPQEMNNPHPAPFPLALAQKCIESTTANVILDPFIGSGTVAIAAELAGRNWIGIDNSPAYCELARRRIRDMSATLL